ncbi:hypothetical protein TcasGA2_TC006171 [Tribolium castaneum]|uniref:Ionotropic glutamate receptor C-terminal domain-containing protein n=3 Tax=Tribolium castaneum TaxID=7070 RepID=D6WV04_TRICA|nr:hypothetical protein TcasGA2_TC006171 [Tribolium castaneum]
MSRPLLNPKGPIHENYALNCLEKIATKQFYKNYFNLDVRLLTIMTTNNMTSPGHQIQKNIIKILNNLLVFNIEVIDDERSDCETTILPRFYLLVVDSINNFDTKLQVLTELNTYNPRALFLVYYSGLGNNYKTKAQHILEQFWQNSITEAAVLIPSNLKHFIVYSMDFSLKAQHHCLKNHKIVIVDYCTRGEVKFNSNFYKRKSLTPFNNCTLEVVANQLEPFVINENEGFEIALLKQIGQTLNITFNVTITGEDSWGVKEEGEWTKGLGQVYQNSAVGIGNFYVAPEYIHDFSNTDAYYLSGLVWIVPIAQYVPKWRVLTVIFSWYLWILCLGLVFVCALLLKVTSLSRNENKHYKKFGNDLLATFQVMIVTAVDRQPRSDFSRIIFIALNFFSIINAAVYTSSLINYLTLPQREPQVDSIEGILAQNWDIGGLPVYHDIFNVTDDEKAVQIYDIFQVNESLYIWLTSVGDDRDTASIVNYVFLDYLLSKNDPLVTDSRGRPKVFVLEDRIFTYSVVMVTNRGFPFLSRFNKVINLMTTHGLPSAMARRYTNVLHRKKHGEGGFVKALTMHHLQGAFLVLVLGYICGFGLFLFEIIFGLIKVRQRKKIKPAKNK